MNLVGLFGSLNEIIGTRLNILNVAGSDRNGRNDRNGWIGSNDRNVRNDCVISKSLCKKQRNHTCNCICLRIIVLLVLGNGYTIF